MTVRSDFADAGQLAAHCTGTVLEPGAGAYEASCTGWNLAWTHDPRVIVLAESVDDVVAAVRFAATHDLGVAVQNTGHAVAVPADRDSVLVVTRRLDHVSVQPQSRTATVGGGATWEPVLEAAQDHGLAPLLGSAPHVGAVGYSLGGGFGWLARKHGLAVDAVRSLRVVLADGSVVTTTPEREPELFWALAGTAGSSLGVVVEMTVSLVPAGDVYAGNLFYPLDLAEDVFDRYAEWSEGTPTELTSAFCVMSFPPLDGVPGLLRGEQFAIVRGCHSGAPGDESGRRAVDEWREWREPLLDTWTTMPFRRAADISMDPVDPVPAASSGRWLRRLDRSVLDAMIEAVVGGEQPSPMLFAETRHGGGAIGDENPSVSFEARGGERLLELVGMIAGPGAGPDLEQRFAGVWERVGPHLAALPGYINFAEGPEKLEVSRRTFDAGTAARLAAAKRRYDPGDRFRHGIQLADLA